MIQAYYEQVWYKEPAKEFGNDYYYPVCSSHSELQLDGSYVKTKQHYKPVRFSTYSNEQVLKSWFVEIYKCSKGKEVFIERYFNAKEN